MDRRDRPSSSSPPSFTCSQVKPDGDAERFTATELERLEEDLRCKSQMAATCVKQEVVEKSTGEVEKVVTGFTFCNHQYNDHEIASLVHEAWNDFHGIENTSEEWPDFKDINFVQEPPAIGPRDLGQYTKDGMDLVFDGCDADFQYMKKTTENKVRQKCLAEEHMRSGDKNEIRKVNESASDHRESSKPNQHGLDFGILSNELMERIEYSEDHPCTSNKLDWQPQSSAGCVGENPADFNLYNELENLINNNDQNIKEGADSLQHRQYNLMDLDLQNIKPESNNALTSYKQFLPDFYNLVDSMTAFNKGPENMLPCFYKTPEKNVNNSTFEHTNMEDYMSIPAVIEEEHSVQERIANAFSQQFCVGREIKDQLNIGYFEEPVPPEKQSVEGDHNSLAIQNYPLVKEAVGNDRLVPQNWMDGPFVGYEAEADKAKENIPESKDNRLINTGESFTGIRSESSIAFKSKVHESFEALLSVAKGDGGSKNVSYKTDTWSSLSEVAKKQKRKKRGLNIATDMDEIQGKKNHLNKWLSSLEICDWQQNPPKRKKSQDE